MRDYGVQLTEEEEGKVDQIVDKIRNRIAKERMTLQAKYMKSCKPGW